MLEQVSVLLLLVTCYHGVPLRVSLSLKLWDSLPHSPKIPVLNINKYLRCLPPWSIDRRTWPGRLRRVPSGWNDTSRAMSRTDWQNTAPWEIHAMLLDISKAARMGAIVSLSIIQIKRGIQGRKMETRGIRGMAESEDGMIVACVKTPVFKTDWRVYGWHMHVEKWVKNVWESCLIHDIKVYFHWRSERGVRTHSDEKYLGRIHSSTRGVEPDQWKNTLNFTLLTTFSRYSRLCEEGTVWIRDKFTLWIKT